MKVMTLLQGQSIELEPGTKIIPSEAISKIRTAATVQKMVQKQVEDYKKATVAEIEKEKEAARQAGFLVGMEEWAAVIAKAHSAGDAAKSEMERLITQAAFKLAKKVVGIEIKEHPELVKEIVANAVKTAAGARKITLYCAPADKKLLEENKSHFAEICKQADRFVIEPRDDLQAGDCIIETDTGIINARLGVLWQTLETHFDKMQKK